MREGECFCTPLLFPLILPSSSPPPSPPPSSSSPAQLALIPKLETLTLEVSTGGSPGQFELDDFLPIACRHLSALRALSVQGHTCLNDR
jgi:hypothetical protein